MYLFVHPLATINIIAPPENVTVCEDSNVTISCGYQSNTSFPAVWKIGRRTYNEAALTSITYPSQYQLNNQSNPLGYSVTIHPIRWTTTIQCGIEVTPNITIYSTHGTVTVVGM